VRVIDGASGKQLGVLGTPQAIRLAKDQGLDLVEVSANVDPPVCKIVDYGKYKYLQEKHKRDAHKHQKISKLKEMKFRIGIDPHDYLIKITHAEDFLFDGHKVRIQLQFRGRQMAHQELGHALVQKIKKDLITMAHVDMEPKMAGRNINMQLSPLPERQRIRKFRNTEKSGDTSHIPHANDVNHEEEHHEEDDDHHEASAAPAEGEAAAAAAVTPAAAAVESEVPAKV
jgi:translation initiation factor IF-3